MPEKLISGDNHIDLTYLPPDLWSSQAPNKWKLLAPRVEEMEARWLPAPFAPFDSRLRLS